MLRKRKLQKIEQKLGGNDVTSKPNLLGYLHLVKEKL